MKRFTFKGHHYIWRPQILAVNLGKGLLAFATGAFYAYMFLAAINGGPLW